MRKFLGVLLVLIILAAINLGVWYWTQYKVKTFEVIKGGQIIIPEKWRKLVATHILDWEVPEGYEIKEVPNYIYVLEPNQKKQAIIYQRVGRRNEKISLDEEVAKHFPNPEACQVRTTRDDFIIYKNCNVEGLTNTYVFFEHTKDFYQITFDHRYLSESQINYIINSLKKL